MVWPVEEYTDQIHFAVNYIFETSAIAFSIEQMASRVRTELPWLTVDTERKTLTLHKIIRTAITRMVQQGTVRQVFYKTQTEPQWMWSKLVSQSAYKDITNNDLVAKTSAAVKAIHRRAVSLSTMFQLNSQTA